MYTVPIRTVVRSSYMYKHGMKKGAAAQGGSLEREKPGVTDGAAAGAAHAIPIFQDGRLKSYQEQPAQEYSLVTAAGAPTCHRPGQFLPFSFWAISAPRQPGGR